MGRKGLWCVCKIRRGLFVVSNSLEHIAANGIIFLC